MLFPECIHNSACFFLFFFLSLKKASCCAEAFRGRTHPSWHRASTAGCHSATSHASSARRQGYAFFSREWHLLMGHCLERRNRACCVPESFLLSLSFICFAIFLFSEGLFKTWPLRIENILPSHNVAQSKGAVYSLYSQPLSFPPCKNIVSSQFAFLWLALWCRWKEKKLIVQIIGVHVIQKILLL